MHRDNVGDLVGGIDGISAVYARRIEIAGIGFVESKGIFPNTQMVIDQTKSRVDPYGITFQLCIDQSAILVHEIKPHKIGGFAGPAAYRYIMVLDRRRLEYIL